MRHRLRHRVRGRILAIAVVAGLAVANLAATPGSALAVDNGKGTPGYCPDADGVTVVIDFQELGGTTIIRCAPGDQATGLAALKNAGIEITGTNRWGEAFICRIEGKPGPSEESCIDTPPATAYWSYWHSPDQGSWQYSQWGAMNRKPPPGSFEGWSFSKDKTETTNPPPDIAPVRPAAPSTGDSGSADGHDAGGADSGDGPGAGQPEGGDEEKPEDESGEAAEESTTGDDSLAGVQEQPVEAEDWTGVGEDGMQSTSADTDRGIPLTTALGIAAVAALAVAGGVVAWRRRPALDDETT